MGRAKIIFMRPSKAMTIRLSADQAEALETVATVEQQPVAEIIRAAITAHVENRRRDPQFQEELRGRIDRAQKFLQR
jgi:predicted transcriptional regulator